jgi:hypothetical protein
LTVFSASHLQYDALLLHEPTERLGDTSVEEGTSGKLTRRLVLDWNPASSIASSHEVSIVVLKFEHSGLSFDLFVSTDLLQTKLRREWR